MKTLVVATLVVSFCLVSSSRDSLAQSNASRAAKAEEIHLSGCPIKLAENCIVLLDERGTPYDITAAPAWANAKSANRAMQRRLAIRLTGTLAEGESGSCRRGVTLKDIRWSYGNRKCATSAAPVPR